MIRILFSGCSFVYGTGLLNEKDDPDHFANVLSTELFENKFLKNIGVSGNTNLRIFLDSCQEISLNNYDYAFVCWTSYPRHIFWLGLEEYETKRTFIPSSIIKSPLIEHRGNDIGFSSSTLINFNNTLSLINHPHYDILDIVIYVNILKSLANSKNTKIYFINNICHWDLDFFKRIDNPLPSNLTQYTNKILNSDNRDDDQIKNLYNKIHDDYESRGSIHEDLWLNLYESFYSQQTDLAIDNRHPGPVSHKNFGSFLAKKFKQLNG